MRHTIVWCIVTFAFVQIVIADNENGNFATYEEVKDISNQPGKYLIEVRSKELVEKDGSIPGSINIPCRLNRFEGKYFDLYLI